MDKNRVLLYAAHLTARGLTQGRKYAHNDVSVQKKGNFFVIESGDNQKISNSPFEAAWVFSQLATKND